MHKKQLPKQFHYIFPSFSDVPAVIQACLLLHLSTATWNLIRYVTVVIRFASLIFIMLLPFPIYLQNRERNAMFNLNTGKSATVILILFVSKGPIYSGERDTVWVLKPRFNLRSVDTLALQNTHSGKALPKSPSKHKNRS